MFREGVQKVGKFLLAIAAGDETEAHAARRRSHENVASRRRTFDQRTQDMMARRPAGSSTILAGAVQLIGLDEIRDSLGSAWPVVARKARAVADRIIRQHLTEEDTFERHRNDTYLVCFASVDKAEAERRTRRIVGEIKAALAAEVPEVEDVRVDQVVAEVEWDSLKEGGEDSLLDALANSLRKVQEEAKNSAKAWRRLLLNDATVLYSPMLRVAHRDVPLYRCLLDDNTGKTTLERLRNVSNPDEVSEALSDLDCLVLSRAIDGLHRLLQAGGKVSELLVPISYYTVHDKSHRDAYMKLCRTVPDSYRKFLLFELHSIPYGAPLSRVTELAQILKPQGHAVAVEASHLSPKRVVELGTNGLFGVSLDAATVTGSASDIASRFARFAMMAKSASLKTFVHGISTMGLAQAATSSGIDFVGGKALGAPLDSPKPAHNLRPAGWR